MINHLFARIQRPENGWDPLDPAYAKQYATAEWATGVKDELLNEIDDWVGGLAGKSVLDLGGGPGQYAVAFAKRGANVVWHDVSRTYMEIAQKHAWGAQVLDQIEFSLGYMDEAPQILGRQFDFVFNRICWYYGFSDKSFADVVYRLIKPGGYAYIDCNHSDGKRDHLSRSARGRTWLNDALGIKIGHPFPPTGRIEQLFRRYPAGMIRRDLRAPQSDRIWFHKSEYAISK